MIATVIQHYDTFALATATVLAAAGGWLAGRARSVAQRDQLRWAACHDALTGVFNRGGWQLRAQDAVVQAVRAGRPVAVGSLDLDHLKAINDGWGHGAGDTVLRHVATRLDRDIRPPGVVARIGGDEFAFILIGPPAAAPTWLTDAAHSLRDKVCRPVRIDGAPHMLSVSLGISPISDGADLEKCLALADAAMYQVKHTRRASAEHSIQPADRLWTVRRGPDAIDRVVVGEGRLKWTEAG
jgi:diguanylate cyclase (GGDEF)-like protein